MLQRLDNPILSLTTKGPINKDTSVVHAESFLSVWSVFRKQKNSLENDRRQENLNWRLWRRGSAQSSTLTTSSSLTMDGDSWSNCSSYTSTPSHSLAASAATLFNEPSTNTTFNEHPSYIESSANNHAQKFYISEFELENPIHADQQRDENDTKDYEIDGPRSQLDRDNEEEDDDMTLFGDDTEQESTIDSSWSCCEFTKKHPPAVDQRSLLSSMLLHHSPCTSTSSLVPAPISTTSGFMVDVLSSSMKQYVQWEKKQNSGPAAGLTVSSIAPPFMIPRDSFDTFKGCW